jgi:outer membrane translocation and assembly module TamA
VSPGAVRRSVPVALLLVAVLPGCASIPNGRYGIERVRFEGAESLDMESLRVCLGTQQRSRFSLDIGTRGAPTCGVPPYDGSHVILDPFAWPWSEWPLFDEAVAERDRERVLRWFRARGFYEAQATYRVDPPTARSFGGAEDACGDGEEDCSVEVTFTVDEGEPVRVARVAVLGDEALPEGLRREVAAAVELEAGDLFDETLFDRARSRMVRVLADGGFARARVAGDSKVSVRRHEAFIAYRVEPGLPAVLSRLCVVGYGGLPARRLLDVAAVDPGTPFSLRRLTEVQRALYALGAFESVEVTPLLDPEDYDPGTEEHPPVCNDGLAAPPPGREAVDVQLRVSPGRLHRYGVGVGIQAGQTVTFGTLTTFEQQAAAQWDFHLSFTYEGRNWFDNLVRLRFEFRPRLIFEMPLFNFTPAQDPPLGIQTVLSLRWPAFLDPRTNLLFQIRDDLGPTPFVGFFRNELDGTLGLERTFFDGRLYAAAFVRANWFLPTARQPEIERDEFPETRALWLEQAFRLDMRDDPRRPTDGFFASLTAQQGVQPLSAWDFLRVVGEVRGYIPLPAGIVLAGRLRVGVMGILGVDNQTLPSNNAFQYDRIGPPALQLQGGGASSHRGYLPGLLGDAEQILVTLPRSDSDIANAVPLRARTVRVNGGNTQWEGSFEIRIPLTTSLGVVGFVDLGDVDRWEVDATNGSLIVLPPRFDRLNPAIGFGLRYFTIIGPLRLDFGFRLPGQNDDLPACTQIDGTNCRPVNRFGLFGTNLDGALHLTVGESF